MIREAAILFRGIVYTGRRHSDVIPIIVKATGVQRVAIADSVQGFVTVDGKFKTRTEAAQIALATGQIQALKYSPTELYSEDLY